MPGSNYVVTAGTYGLNSQTTTLNVKADANTVDSTYTCVISSDEHEESDKPTSVTLNVFGKQTLIYRVYEISFTINI